MSVSVTLSWIDQWSDTVESIFLSSDAACSKARLQNLYMPRTHSYASGLSSLTLPGDARDLIEDLLLANQMLCQ